MTGQEENLGEILKKAAQRIEDVGTPKDIPDDAKEGLQLTLDAIADLPDDASVEDMGAPRGRFSEADKEKTDAFSEYLEKTCPDLGDSGDPESDSGSGSSDVPSDDASERQLMRLGLLAASLVLVAGGAVGCSDDGGGAVVVATMRRRPRSSVAR